MSSVRTYLEQATLDTSDISAPYPATTASDESDSDLITTASHALASGDMVTARRLTEQLVERCPDNPTVQHLSRILAPPTFTLKRGEPDRTLGPERSWLRLHAAQYPGHWIALKEDRLLAARPQLSEVRAAIRDRADLSEVVIWYEPVDPHQC